MYIGIDLGGTTMTAGVVDDHFAIVKKKTFDVHPEWGADAVIEEMITLTRELLSDNDINEELQWIGIGSPGVIDARNGTIVSSPNIPFNNTPVVQRFSQRFTLPVYIENDANCAALGEMKAGCARGYENVILVTLGTGIGGGIILGGNIYSGLNGCAGEIGHSVICLDGLPCGCGRTGCWESYASVSALVRQTKKAMESVPGSLMWEGVHDISRVNGMTSFSAAKKKDPAAVEVVRQYEKYLACGLINLINTFQPDAIIIGGGISREGSTLLDPLKEIIEKQQYFRGEKADPSAERRTGQRRGDHRSGAVGAGRRININILFRQKNCDRQQRCQEERLLKLTESLVEKIKTALPELTVLKNEPMSRHTTFAIGGPADLLAEPSSRAELEKLYAICLDTGVRPFFMGNGSNLLVSDKGIEGIVVKTTGLRHIGMISDNEIEAESGALLSRTSKFALKQGLSGLEFAEGIPGSVGGALFMNAGAYGGQMADVVTQSVYLNGLGQRSVLSGGEHLFGYRKSFFSENPERVAVSTRIRLIPGDGEEIKNKMDELRGRRCASQPLELPSAGSVFRRPEGHYVGPLIEKAGLKGCRVGGAQVSEKTCRIYCQPRRRNLRRCAGFDRNHS